MVMSFMMLGMMLILIGLLWLRIERCYSTCLYCGYVTGGVPDLSKISVMSLQGDPVAYQGCVRKFIVNGFNYQLTETGTNYQVSIFSFL